MDDDQKKMAEELLFSGEQKPSFAKQLYFGEFDASYVIPFPKSRYKDAETEEFLEKVEAFTTEHIDADAIDRNAEIPDSVIQGLGKLGVLGVTIPKEYGGMGLSQYAYCKATEIIARRCGSTALFVNAHQSVGLKALQLFGTEEQKKKWLPPLAKGEILAAFSLTEPNAGSDAAGIETRAVYNPEEKTYTINGKKQWSTNASIAGMFTVMAKTEVETKNGMEEKVTAFIVTPDMPGITITDPALEKVGMRGTKTTNYKLENVVVPEENILGKLGGGLRVCLTVLDYGRTTFGSTCTGAAQTQVKRALAHARTRYQFNRPLSYFPLIKSKLAYMASHLYAMEATTSLTAGILDRGEEDIMIESAMLKVFSSEALWKINYETMQIFGGRSFFTDEPFERMMRDARLNMIGEGANEVLRAFIGVVGMRDVGMELKHGLDAIKNPWKNGKYLSPMIKHLMGRLKKPDIPIRSDHLQAECNELAKTIKRFGWKILKLLSQYREEILEKQFHLDRIATCGISIYTTTAVLSRLDMELSNGVASAETVRIAKLYCHQSLSEGNAALNAIRKNRDEEIEKVSDGLTIG